MKISAKDEEEKRTKAINLLKTVRQKLVKAEKERDDAVKELQAVKSREKEEREKDKMEKQKLHDEIDKVNSERETAIQGLKAQFDKEVASLKDRQEKELTALRGQYELEAITMKVRILHPFITFNIVSYNLSTVTTHQRGREQNISYLQPRSIFAHYREGERRNL
jgi:hypothetical protein